MVAHEVVPSLNLAVKARAAQDKGGTKKQHEIQRGQVYNEEENLTQLIHSR